MPGYRVASRAWLTEDQRLYISLDLHAAQHAAHLGPKLSAELRQSGVAR
jgi:hypothetical protein